MLRAALCLGALLSTLMPCVGVLAHGVPPAAYAVLSHDAQGARAVHFSHGLALRRPGQRYQYVCPAAWGDMFSRPLAALPDGTIVAGGTTGLMLIGEDGTVRAHPDPVAVGFSTELVRSGAGVFSLRPTLEGSEVLAIDAQKVRVLWKEAKSFTSLAAFDDKIVLLRTSNLSIEQVTIAAATGQELDRQVALVQSPIDYVFARAEAGAAYALVMFRTSTVLGRLEMNAFTKIAQGELSVAGPLRSGESMLLALDGKLSQLVGGQPTPLVGDDNVFCLAQHDGLSYACNTDGIARVNGQALGEPLFQLRWLTAPKLEPSGTLRDQCNAQWQDLRVDLMMAGTTLLEDALPDAGTPAPDVAVVVDAAMVIDGASAEDGALAPEAGLADAGPMLVGEPEKNGRGGCAALPRQGCNFAAYLYLALMLVFRRNRAAFRGARALVHARSQDGDEF